MNIPEDLSANERIAVTLKLRLNSVPDARQCTVRVNGNELGSPAVAAPWISYVCDPAFFKKGINTVELVLRQNASPKIKWQDAAVEVRPKE